MLALVNTSTAQQSVSWPSPEVEQMYKQAREFHSKGNLKQAIMMYKQAIQAAPGIMLLHRELGQAQYISGDYAEAQNTLQPVIDNGAADEETYHIMASSQMSRGDHKKARNTIKAALERYPHSGILYNLSGKMYEANNERPEALQAWLLGIENDPGYHINYYDAARAYMDAGVYTWAILYGEMFINIEQQTPRSHDMRKMVMNSYAKMFQSVEAVKFGKTNAPVSGFERAVYNTYIKLSPVVADGFTAENLTMLRTRFMMDWFTMGYNRRFPFSLFTRHDDMIRNGYFDIYNQWLFGKAENPAVYDAWTKFHADAIPEMEEYLKENPYHPGGADFHNNKQVDDLFKKKKKG
ncbi:tetratricopeptide repeat protein [Polluticoccus soli]|uniref:tetratricopeptide repeat protein n=1 Tax=Polluticoccus soli TaxID=3034150 RepID=UPI0023E21F88|nr:tetratricopeptide repeat protein [Flavipsychrobacter sp. JY13-12]